MQTSATSFSGGRLVALGDRTRPHSPGCFHAPRCSRSIPLQAEHTLGRVLRLHCTTPRRFVTMASAASTEQASAGLPGSFDIPAAPILIPEGPWKVIDGGVTAPAGFKAQGMYAGLRAKGDKADLALVVSDTPAVAAGAFTLNVMAAAPVTLCREVLAAHETVRGVVINAGQANAATGAAGDRDARAATAAAADALGGDEAFDPFLVMSTGVIGRRVDADALSAALPVLAAGLGAGAGHALRAAVAITTTDLASKSAALEVELAPGRTVRLGGMCKGSGMIHPNMATMLGVVTCDAPVAAAVWRPALAAACAASFNQITVDGDTSTNDTVLGLANGAAGGAAIGDPNSPEARALGAALTVLLQGLAKSIAWDGEGATMLLECTARGARSDADARRVARSVVGSSLVKSAMFGHDPNWGRIAAAAGYSGVDYRQEDVRISLGDTELMRGGQPLDFDAAAASAYMKAAAAAHGTVTIEVSIGDGPGVGQAWGCDLSYDYVKINAEYTT
ncbi:NAGS1 [Auxenochlorella protothecoides x Auxenochlorella symbiontica]